MDARIDFRDSKKRMEQFQGMKLSILFTANGLTDLYQSIQYGSEKPEVLRENALILKIIGRVQS